MSTVLEVDQMGDWDHYLDPDEWQRVTARADEVRDLRYRELPNLTGARTLVAPTLTPKYIDFPNSPNDKSSTLVRKQLYVVHTAECPLAVGYAQSLTEWADGDSYNPRVSWHRFVDPATVARFIKTSEAAWHAKGANSISIGYEQSGYASYDRAKWLTAQGQAQISLLAQQMVIDGLPTSAIRRLTTAQVKAILNGTDKTTVGICSHAQISDALGLGTRTDPGAGWPWDVFISWVDHFHPGTASTPPPSTVTNTNLNAIPAFPLPSGHWFGVNDGTPYSHSGVRGGTDDDNVRKIQGKINVWLKAAGKTLLTVDGDYGAKTEAAVKAWQYAHRAGIYDHKYNGLFGRHSWNYAF